MPLDPLARQYLELITKLGLAPVEQLTPAEARAQMTPAPRPRPPIGDVRDMRITGPGGPLVVRVYTPARSTVAHHDSGRPPDVLTRPVLMFFHGGGWVVGDLETHDGLCRHLANSAGAVVVAVDYRRAPEHKYPAAAEDAYTATCWASEHAAELRVDPERLIVAGDSAGGNLAAAVTLMARDRGTPRIGQQLLLYPVTDYSFDTESYREFHDGYFLTRPAMRWFWQQYLAREADGQQPYASPLKAADLTGLPPAIVITAECDVLRDEGEAYATRLATCGVPTHLRRCPGMLHGFVRRTDTFWQAAETLAWIGPMLQDGFL